MNTKYDPVKLLQDNQVIQIPPTGFSMYPFINPNQKDQVVLEPIGDIKLKRGDVVLYRRHKAPGTKVLDNRLILHRIYTVKNNDYYMVGDNQKEIEGPIKSSDIYGIMTGIVKNGKTISTSSFSYLVKAKTWLILRPMRPVISKTIVGIKSFLIKKDR